MSCLNETECFDVTWNIKNFSECLFEEGISLGTPIFKTNTADGSSHTWWKLYLETGESSISSLIVKLEKMRGVSVVSKCELSLSSVFGVIKLPQEELSTNGSYSWFKIHKSSIFSEKNLVTHPQIPKDVITVNFKIWHEMLKPGKILFGSILKKVHLCYQMNGSTSSHFIYDQDNLQITITTYQGGNCEHSNYKCKRWYKVLVEILPSKEGGHSFVKGKLACENGGFTVDGKNIIAQAGRLTCCTRIWEISSILMNKLFELEFIIAKETVKNPNSQHIPSPLDSLEEVHISSDPTALTLDQVPVPVSLQTLRKDLMHLYSEKLFSDATLIIEGKSFSAHKSILSARSSVFRAMFEKDQMSEGRSGIVNIDDMDSKTVDRMLVFLYSGSIKGLQWEEAMSLYYAADKYAIHTLKEKCTDILKANLSVDNACEALILADKHSEEQLMRGTVDFIRYHDEVLSSAEWEELEEGNPRLTTKVMRELYSKKRKT